ncbi:hypothetical protein ES705_25019 [subsurface metagenome]
MKKSSFLKRIIIISFLIVNLTGFSQTEKDFRHIFQEAEYYFYSESDYENAITFKEDVYIPDHLKGDKRLYKS